MKSARKSQMKIPTKVPTKNPMGKYLIVVAAVLLSLPAAIFAHRLDEYLQATILSVNANRVDGSMRLVPGVAVSSVVIASIDTDRDGAFSAVEQTPMH
jgi:hypothetical protein